MVLCANNYIIIIAKNCINRGVMSKNDITIIADSGKTFILLGRRCFDFKKSIITMYSRENKTSLTPQWLSKL